MALALLLRPLVDERHSLAAAYRHETDQLIAERLPLTVALCLGLLALSGPFEYWRAPHHWRWFLAAFGLQATVLLALLAGRRRLLQRGWLQAANIAAWPIVAVLMTTYNATTGTPPAVVAIGSVCLMTGLSLMLPWGVRGQAVLVGIALAALAGPTIAGAAASLPAPYVLFAAAAGGAISLFGAHHLELHRFAIFCEVTRSEEEAAIGQSLVAIAREINDSLDADDVLDRIAEVIRTALHASWSAIVLRETGRDGYVILGTAGRLPTAIAGLRGVEFGGGAFPLVDRILRDRDVALRADDAEAETAALLQRWDTRSLLGAALLRRDGAIGVLLAGTHTGAFAERGQALARGVAQHAAVALNNVRLVADLRHANNLKSEFLSTMSHELRTPLNVIIGYADLLRDGAFGPVGGDQPDVLGRLRDNAHSLLELINATLEVNRLEAGHERVHLRELSLRTWLAELQQEVEQMPRSPGVTLHWEVARSAELVRTDPMKLKIIVRNLVGNALKFTPRGSVTVSVQLDPRSRLLDVRVRDTGIGIPADQLPHVFDMFHQAPTTATTAGVGLGLYIVRRFAELLGGRIHVSSRVGEGSIFRLTLPAGVVLVEPAAADADHPHLRRTA